MLQRPCYRLGCKIVGCLIRAKLSRYPFEGEICGYYVAVKVHGRDWLMGPHRVEAGGVYLPAGIMQLILPWGFIGRVFGGLYGHAQNVPLIVHAPQQWQCFEVVPGLNIAQSAWFAVCSLVNEFNGFVLCALPGGGGYFLGVALYLVQKSEIFHNCIVI